MILDNICLYIRRVRMNEMRVESRVRIRTRCYITRRVRANERLLNACAQTRCFDASPCQLFSIDVRSRIGKNESYFTDASLCSRVTYAIILDDSMSRNFYANTYSFTRRTARSLDCHCLHLTVYVSPLLRRQRETLCSKRVAIFFHCLCRPSHVNFHLFSD